MIHSAILLKCERRIDRLNDLATINNKDKDICIYGVYSCVT